jgi:hypothetical protein
MSQLRAFELALAPDERGGTLVVGGGMADQSIVIPDADGTYPLLPSGLTIGHAATQLPHHGQGAAGPPAILHRFRAVNEAPQPTTPR